MSDSKLIALYYANYELFLLHIFVFLQIHILI